MSDTKAVILAGGLGTRLRSVLPSAPKVLASLGQESFLELLLRQLRSQGINRFVICTGYLADQIESRLGDGTKWEVAIEYSREDSPLGTAGALRLAKRYVQHLSEFFVLNGDSFLETNFLELMRFHRSHADAVATIAVVGVEDGTRYGTVQVDSNGKVNGFSEKHGCNTPGLVNGGVYLFNQAIWEFIPAGPASLEREVFPQLIGQGLYAQEQYGTFIDIGTPSDYAHAQELLRGR
jgi:NDP-sugar pyrophosphorylase family protein